MRDRLIELIESARYWGSGTSAEIADKILADGWMRPPCKVGDVVYKVWYSKCHNGETYPDSWSCSGCYDECDMKKEITEIVVPNLRFIVENFMGGYTNDVYFLTREEALKALKGGAE